MNNRTAALAVFFMFCAPCIHSQQDDGILMEIQEVNIPIMREGRLTGAEAVMAVLEQFTDRQYRFAFISNNYLLPVQQQKNLNMGRDRFMVAVAEYPSRNNLLFTQVIYNDSFFFIALTKREEDMKRTGDMQIIRMNYEKGNTVRRNNVLDTIRRNNTIPLGIDTERGQ